ncbi:hypothetical protein GN956_G9672 [Arapaima gigas]
MMTRLNNNWGPPTGTAWVGRCWNGLREQHTEELQILFSTQEGQISCTHSSAPHPSLVSGIKTLNPGCGA